MGIQTTVKPKTQGNMPAQYSGKMVQTGVFHLVFNYHGIYSVFKQVLLQKAANPK